MVPDSAEPGRGRSWGIKKLALTAVIAVAAIIVGGLFTFGLDTFLSPARAKQDDKNQDTIENAKEAFAWRLAPALDDDEPWESWEIDRTLTTQEREKLENLDGTKKETVWEFVRGLQGRRVRGIAAIYTLQLTSEKQKSVLITKISANVTRCWDSKARTLLSDGTGGSEGWDEIHFNLETNGAAAAPLGYTEVEPGQVPEEIPYKKAISLGNTQSPGLLSMTPYVRGNQDCEWQLVLNYNVNSGEMQSQTINQDSSGKKLMVYGLTRTNVESWAWTGPPPEYPGWSHSKY
ncbi:hypothetical protein [Streptomyces sp. NPDC057426]|uniref:hypothetical protein n=1 Tax=Streptomyces sp. NPDC057426 TaxID=3346128 RepID=UPI00369EABBB